MSIATDIEAKILRDERRLMAWQNLESRGFNLHQPVADFVRVTYESSNGQRAEFVMWRHVSGAWHNNKNGERTMVESWPTILGFVAIHERTPVRFECWTDNGREVFDFIGGK